MFFNRETGRKFFLEWARKTISRGRRVTIVDPYFDEKGLQDFDACIDTQLKVRILMLDPQNLDDDTNALLNLIYAALPEAEIYIVDNIHDRYLVVEEDERTFVYSLSNSWNGTVKNYSLFVQVLNPKYIGFQWIDGHYKLQLTYNEGYVNDHMIFWTYSLNRLFVQSVTKIEKSMEIFNAF
jgi:hypothetical protein